MYIPKRFQVQQFSFTWNCFVSYRAVVRLRACVCVCMLIDYSFVIVFVVVIGILRAQTRFNNLNQNARLVYARLVDQHFSLYGII